MLATYRAVLVGDRLVWREPPPPLIDDGAGVSVYVTFVEEAPAELEERRDHVRQLLEGLAASGVFSEIEDPVAWQREIRRDRALPWDD